VGGFKSKIMKDYFSTLSMEELEKQFEESKYFEPTVIEIPKNNGIKKRNKKAKKNACNANHKKD
jgi:hypothetical protein